MSLQRLPRYEQNMTDPNAHIAIGEPPRDRTIFTTITLLCLIFVSLLLGLRLPKLRKNIVLNRKVVSLLFFLMYMLVLVFLIISNVLVAGQGMYTHGLCVTAAWTCLLLYSLIKFIIYLFFVERIHVVRAPFTKRRKDKIYLSCMAMIVVLYSTVTINAYVNHIGELWPSDGRCHLGVHTAVSIPFTTVNFFMETVLVAVFFYLLRPVVRKLKPCTYSAAMAKGTDRSEHVHHGGSDTSLRKSIRTLLWKSLIGGILIEIPTAANMIQFVVTKGKTLGLVCLTICVVDVCWDAVVMHWLLFGSSGSAAEKNISQATMVARDTSLRSISRISEIQPWSHKRPNISPQSAVWDRRDQRATGSDITDDESRASVSDLITPAPAKLCHPINKIS